jgi:predicted dehydrogenase
MTGRANGDSDLNIGFIGLGGIARSKHLPGLTRIPGVSVVAVANRSEESSARAADEFGILGVCTDWREVVESEHVDAVFIGTWPNMHREISIAALEAGKHVFCQARMARNLGEAKEMVRKAREHPSLVNMICPPPHRMPFEPYIKNVITSGELGSLYLVSLESRGNANRDASRIHWREDVSLSGRQALSLGIYAETLNAWLGPYRSLSASLLTPIDKKSGPDGMTRAIEIPQVIAISGELDSGALITEHHSGLTPDISTPAQLLTLWGLEGTIRYDFTAKKLYRGVDGEKLKPIVAPEKLTRPWNAEKDFIDAVRAARRGDTWQVSPDFEEGLLYMRKVEAVYASATAGRAVDPARL